MTLRVYNTLTRQKEEFKPQQPGKVGMYVCGPTVYKPSHIGHMVGPVIFDTVKRYLTYLGYQVTWVVNITDVDDKLIVRSKELGTTVKDLAEKMTVDYLECLKKLNVTGIDLMPKATEHIPQMIEMMQGLIEKGHAYPAGGDVYFDVTKDEDYGKLCNRKIEDMEAGEGVEGSDRKRNKGDFALWKGAKPGEPSWDSPWGPGRPGWHIECSAMSMKYLGKTLDIHGGGLDLQFPHHENELAQSESYTGQPFASYWMHNGLMRIRKQAGKVGGRPATDADSESEKMGGSLNNAINVVEILKKHDPETLRLLLLATHYRSPIEYSDERLAEVRRSLDGFYRFIERYQRITKEEFHQVLVAKQRQPLEAKGELLSQVGRLRQQFLDHMDDDFNTGGAVGVLYELLTTLNRFGDQRKLEEANGDPVAIAEFRAVTVVFKELSQLLGLFERSTTKAMTGNDQLISGLMQLLIDLRAEIRTEAKGIADKAQKGKMFALTDKIRARLAELGVTLEDRPGGTGWRLG
jgi:cysteinyl-tRNA synthetase